MTVYQKTFSLRHISIDEAVKVLMLLGPRTLMAKFDVDCMYRNAAMHLDEHYLFDIFS